MDQQYVADSRGLFCALCGKTAIRHVLWHGKRLCSLPTAANDEIADLARCLTPAQRQAILTTPPDETRAFSEVHGIPRVALFRQGLFGSTDYADQYRFQLTERGKLVRDHLLNTNESV